MIKNLKDETTETEKTAETIKKTSHLIICSGVILLICMGLCISYDLHQTKEISAKILPQMQADYEAKIANLDAQVELLQRDFNKMKSEHLSVEAMSEEYVDEKLEKFKEDILSKAPDTASEQIIQNNAKIAILEKTISNLQQEQIVPQEVLLASGVLTIRSMAENGENFAYEAEILQIMAQGNQVAEDYISEIRRFSTQPLSNKKSLIDEFKRIYADLSGMEITSPLESQKEEDATSAKTWKEAFLSRLKNLITFKHKKTVKFEKAPDKVYDLVENGDLAQALELIKTDKKYVMLNSPALDVWKHNVQDYLDFDSAVNGLLMNTLAHLHLKQFEHDRK